MRILTFVFIRLASHYIYEDEDLEAAYQVMKNEPEMALDAYYKAWQDETLEDEAAVVTHYRRLTKLYNLVCSKLNIIDDADDDADW